MIKESITPNDVVNLLNELLKLDPKGITNLFKTYVNVNDAIENHPTVQITGCDSALLGIMGILNGLFGTLEDESGVIYYSIDETVGNILNFGVKPIK